MAGVVLRARAAVAGKLPAMVGARKSDSSAASNLAFARQVWYFEGLQASRNGRLCEVTFKRVQSRLCVAGMLL